MQTKPAKRHFIVIDDDPVNNHICSKYIEIVFPEAEITTFTYPQKGLDHIQESYSGGPVKDTILLLDINMPVLSGWDVLERFMLFPDEVKKQFTIYILSSSVNFEDRKKADSCALVAGFLEKPLSIERLQELDKELA